MFPYCCLLIIASIITMFSFQGAFESIKDSVKSQLRLGLQSIFKRSGGPNWTRTIDLTIISRVL